MIVKLNGEYTKDFLQAFYDAFTQNDYAIFHQFCNDNLITKDEVAEILTVLFRDNYVDNQRNH
jgi:hypothetical protein